MGVYHFRITDLFLVLVLSGAGLELGARQIAQLQDAEQGKHKKFGMVRLNIEDADALAPSLTNKPIYAKVVGYGPAGPVMCVDLIPWEVCGNDLKVNVFARKRKVLHDDAEREDP